MKYVNDELGLRERRGLRVTPSSGPRPWGFGEGLLGEEPAWECDGIISALDMLGLESV